MTPGTKLGPYEILSPIGAGGMGEVYKARDTRLGRDVAIKISAEQFSERFEREARSIAALNHPNICHLYDVGPNYLVMELIDGEPLKGPLPLDQALDYARQIAEALVAAHEKGIVHRDLKPGNILVTASGAVKVLDFGLAKTADPPASNPENSPTITMSPTRAGMILGTAPYMAPEQARGKPVDKRADIWAFGCVLYEILTGQRAFTGETTADILAAVVKTEPDLSQAPPKVRRLLRRCLEKDPNNRLRDIGDAWDLLDTPESPAAAGKSHWPWILTASAVTIAVGLGITLWRATRPVDHPLTILTVDLGPNAIAGPDTTVAISPDGRRIVYPARGPNGKQVLATRQLDQPEPTLLPGTEDGNRPFFSPDGQWIGFFAGGQLKKISVEGGAPVALCSAPSSFGASWGEDNRIVAAASPLWPLVWIPASGGTPRTLTRLAPGDHSHRWPQVMPGGNAVLFTASTPQITWDDANIEVLSLKTGQVKIVQSGGYHGHYLPSGHLIFVHQGTLFGVKFDLAKLEALGAPVPIVKDVAGDPLTGDGQFDVSGSGTFVYHAGKTSRQGLEIDWLDSSGKLQPLVSAPGSYMNPSFSPDGRKLAFSDGDVLTYDIGRDTPTRMTFSGSSSVGVWAPDGKHLALASAANGFNISWVRSDGAGPVETLLKKPDLMVPWSFSPDGRRLAYFQSTAAGAWHLWTLPLDLSDPDHPKPGKPEPYLSTPASEVVPMFSPDGHWIAYRSNESGTDEIYVRPFPNANGGRSQISSGGGRFAFWSKKSHELFYETADDRIMVLDYTVQGSSFVPGKPHLWYDKPLFSVGPSNLDLAPDGKRFAVLAQRQTSPSAASPARVTFLFNFFDELQRRLP